MPDKNITFEIREYLGVISQHDSGWNKELNIISWNGQSPKYDLGDWDPHHERMSRGITLLPGEMRKLVDLYFARRLPRRCIAHRIRAVCTSDRIPNGKTAGNLAGRIFLICL